MPIPNEAMEAISAWKIGQVATCRLVRQGVVNRNFILRTSQGKFILRQVSHVHHKNTRDLEFELSYLDYLKNANFPYGIPSVVPTADGGLFVTFQGYYYWPYTFLEDSVVDRLKDPHIAQQ